MTVLVENQQDKVDFTGRIEQILNETAQLSLRNEGFKMPCEVSYLLVDNTRIKEINSEHRNIDKATDVLSFPIADIVDGKLQPNSGDFDLDEETLLLGDIVISLEMALEQAELYGHTFERELAFLAAHGMYHLLGFDHEAEDEEKRMMDKQEAVLEEMGLKRACY